jgi:hypothetical protein
LNAPRPNRAELWREYQQLEGRIEDATKALPASRQLGGVSQQRKVERRIAVMEQRMTAIHQILFPIADSGIWDSDPPRDACTYCGLELLEGEAYRTGGICPRCDPKSPGLSPNDPRWSPLYDDPNSPNYHRR